MNAYKNKKLQKLLIFSTLVSSCCIFSPKQDSNALMRFFRGIRGGFNTTGSGNSTSNTIAGISSSEGKFTPLTNATPTSSPSQQTNLKPDTNISSGKKSNKSTSSSAIKLQAKIEASKSMIDLNQGYKEILEDGIKKSNNPRVQQLLYMDLMNTSTFIAKAEHKNKKLQKQLNKIQNNN